MAWESGCLSQRGNIQDRTWDKRCHRRFGQAACSSRLGVRAAGLAVEASASVPQASRGEGDHSRAQGVSSNLMMFADVTPPLSKHRGWPRPHATLWQTPEPVCGQEEHRGLLAQGQLRRSMDPGKHTAGSATAPSLAHLWARSALRLNACVRQRCLCDIPVWWVPAATRPCGVPPGHPRVGFEHSQPQFPPSAKRQELGE